MKNKALILLLGLTIVAMPSRAQDNNDEDFSAIRWRGGTTAFNLQMRFDMTGGLGAGTLGGVISHRVSGGAASLFSNPAELGFLKRQQLTLDTKLGIGSSTFGFDEGSISSQDIEESTDDFLNELNFPEDGNPVYTEISNFNIAQTGQLTSLGLAVPVHERFVVAIGAHYPINLALDLQANDIETVLDAGQTAGDQVIDIKMLMNVSAAVNLGMSMNTFSLGAGSYHTLGEFGELAVGFSLNRYSIRNYLNVNIQPRGMVVVSQAREYFFNDPDDPNLAEDETNRLYLRARGDYRATEWGARLGISYQPPVRYFNVSLVYNSMPDFTLTDPAATSETYLPIFVNTDGKMDPEEGEEELMDVSGINLAKPNLTQVELDSLVGPEIHLTVPSSLTLGLDFALGPHTIAVNYLRYFGDLSFGLTMRENRLVGKQTTHGFRVGMDFKFPDKLQGLAFALLPVRLLFLDIDGLIFQALGKYTKYSNPHYRFGGGAFFGTGLLEGFDDDNDLRNALDAPLPSSFMLGRQYTLLNSLDVGVMLFGIPDLAFRFSLAYHFL